jgi:hypothetical protein
MSYGSANKVQGQFQKGEWLHFSLIPPPLHPTVNITKYYKLTAGLCLQTKICYNLQLAYGTEGSV